MPLRSLKPTLIIGLGNQGKKVLEDFKSELFSSYGHLPAIQFLSVNYKDEVLEEENQKALIQDFFAFRLARDVLLDWLKDTNCNLNAEKFIEEHKLRDKYREELQKTILRKPEGDPVKINIDEKPYMGYDPGGLKKAIETNRVKFETDGMTKIKGIIDSNLSTGKEKILYDLEEALKNSKLFDRNTSNFLESLEKEKNLMEVSIKKELEKVNKDCEFQSAHLMKLLDGTLTVTDSGLPSHRKKLIESLEKKLNLMVEIKAYSALIELLSDFGKTLNLKIQGIKKRQNLLSYIQEKIKEAVREEGLDEKRDIYTEQRKCYERLKGCINRLKERFSPLIEKEWLELDSKEEFLSKFSRFFQECFIPSDRDEGMTSGNIRITLTLDEMILLPKETSPHMEKRSYTWADYNRWIEGEIKKIKQREPLPEDIKEATRAIARSIFWENLDDISGRLDKKLIDVSLLSNRAVLNEKGFELAEANDFDIFLIAALDDPLASGIYIDMIYLTEDRVIYNHGTSNRYALLFLPALLEGTMKDKNEMQSMACAALSELEHFLQKKEFKKYYYPGHLEVEIKEKPFNAVFLVDYINSQGFALQSESERNQMFREMLRGMILTPLGPNLKSLPHITSSLEGYVDGKNTSYGSFGISIMQFPASLVRKYCACLLGERIYSGILLREDINENKINQEYETCMNFINSIQDSSFIPPTPKLDRKQFEGVDPSILMNRIKHEAGLLESRFTEEIQRDFQKQENLEKIQTTVKDHVNLLSKDTSTALRSVPVFMDKVYNEIKAKKEETKKKYQYIREIVQQDEKNHLGTFDLFQSVIDSFAIPFIGAIIPAKRIKLIGILSCIPLLIILIAAIIILPLFILFFAYLVPFFWYLRSWKCYFERYFESRDALFNHIDNKILNRGKLISLEFKLRELEKIEEFCLNYIDYFEKIIMKLSGISKEFKEEAKDIREEIFAPRGALTYLLITDKYIETYRKDGEKTLSYEAKSLYENIGNWDDPSPVLKEKTTKILWERYAFIQEISADELLRGQENSLFKIEDILRMSHPFWTIDEIKLSQSGNRGKIYFCGVRGAEESFLAKGLKEKPLFSNMIFFNLNNPHILLLGQIETGSPLFALKTFSQMRKSYKFLSTQKIYRAIEDATTEVLPLKMTEKYSQIRRIYLPSTLLGIYNAPLHMEEAEIYQNLIDNPDFLSIIEEKLQRFIQEQGKDTVIKRLMEISSEKTFSAEDREVIREYINDLRRET